MSEALGIWHILSTFIVYWSSNIYQTPVSFQLSPELLPR